MWHSVSSNSGGEYGQQSPVSFLILPPVWFNPSNVFQAYKCGCRLIHFAVSLLTFFFHDYVTIPIIALCYSLVSFGFDWCWSVLKSKVWAALGKLCSSSHFDAENGTWGNCWFLLQRTVLCGWFKTTVLWCFPLQHSIYKSPWRLLANVS